MEKHWSFSSRMLRSQAILRSPLQARLTACTMHVGEVAPGVDEDDDEDDEPPDAAPSQGA